jgi:L-arabinokinase
MGGIADYSGSLVLELPLEEATFAAAQETDEPVLEALSLPPAEGEVPRYCRLPLSLIQTGEIADYHQAGQYFLSQPAERWAAYTLGTILSLAFEGKISLRKGLRLFIWSTVPEGKGVSSSAALEVASMVAVASLLGVPLEGAEVALLCQKVENLIALAPCGVMDQMTSALGQAGQLFALRCQPAQVLPSVPLPPGLAFWGIDSGVRHSVSGSDYTSVRVGAFMGYRIIAELAGLKVLPGDRPGLIQVEDPRWHGYLANIRPAEFEEHFLPHLPETISGEEFLDRYQGTTDPVTRVDPGRHYPVLAATAHPIYENARVERFAQLLGQEDVAEHLEELGQLMYGSHQSYSRCGLGTWQTDLIVELVQQAGPERGLYGAKITGGGSGGCVAVLGRQGADEAIRHICARYAAETGYHPYVFAGSSPGALAFGTFRLAGGPDR